MKTNKSPNLSPEEENQVELDIYQQIISAGMFIPTTEEEVALMEKILAKDGYDCDIAKPTVDTILNRTPNSVQSQNLYGGSTYAVAARKGQQLSDYSKNKMELLKSKNKIS